MVAQLASFGRDLKTESHLPRRHGMEEHSRKGQVRPEESREQSCEGWGNHTSTEEGGHSVQAAMSLKRSLCRGTETTATVRDLQSLNRTEIYFKMQGSKPYSSPCPKIQAQLLLSEPQEAALELRAFFQTPALAWKQ